MSGTFSMESAIEAASNLKDSVLVLFDSYNKLAAIIELEHAAIKASNLIEIEKIVVDKQAIGAAIESSVTSMRMAASKLAQIHTALTLPPKPHASISDCLGLLADIRESLAANKFGTQVFDHVMNGLKTAFDKFATVKATVQPKVEMNKYLTEKLLHHHQQTFRFWQELAQESVATYGPAGLQKPASAATAFRVKA